LARPVILRAIAVLAMAAASACATTPKEHPIVRIAMFDLNCPREQLSYTKIDDGTWGVDGCGQRRKYVRICRTVGEGIFAQDRCRWVGN
jgi:hypothetical protein